MDLLVFMDFVKYVFLRIFVFEENRFSYVNYRYLFFIFNEFKYINFMGKIKIENIMYMYKYVYFV